MIGLFQWKDMVTTGGEDTCLGQSTNASSFGASIATAGMLGYAPTLALAAMSFVPRARLTCSRPPSPRHDPILAPVHLIDLPKAVFKQGQDGYPSAKE